MNKRLRRIKLNYISQMKFGMFSKSDLPDHAAITSSQDRRVYEELEETGYGAMKLNILRLIQGLCKKSDSNDGGYCYMSQTHLAAKRNISVRVLQRHLSDLERDGVLISRPNPEPPYQNFYVIDFHVVGSIKKQLAERKDKIRAKGKEVRLKAIEEKRKTDAQQQLPEYVPTGHLWNSERVQSADSALGENPTAPTSTCSGGDTSKCSGGIRAYAPFGDEQVLRGVTSICSDNKQYISSYTQRDTVVDRCQQTAADHQGPWELKEKAKPEIASIPTTWVPSAVEQEMLAALQGDVLSRRSRSDHN